ncbi:NAD(P)/FAD-dependent oxidoreductase [Bradyrhizobium sp. 521_C7_N1_3]|uniref:NAD(P)/FAD-dependent oxidoreductase n=1 Tax=Bradyrhizobium TaxID=374 RepID=UPI00271531F6|nr:FAD-dependent oxidoreductase [Bradyrhizobium japonicum]WLB56580.1 FAD-dependent oxidoreductase [Bradyrhizobium japonicum]WLB61526.1 FAD-dependent oxidoreductase [Bradyrhizobium japonicum]
MSGLVIIGASYAGVQAALNARQAGYSEPVTMVADEYSLPYERPPLSKEFLLDAAGEQNLVLRDGAFFAREQIDLLFGYSVIKIDRGARRIALADGTRLGFDKLVIATGSRARRISVPGAELDGVCYLRTVADAIDLKARLGRTTEVVIVGGGFIGLEVASSAAKLGKKVTLVEAASRLLERAVSPIVSRFLLDVHAQAGVDVRLGETVVSMTGDAGRVAGIDLGRGDRLSAELVVVGIGGIASDGLASDAGLNCSNGIVVDEHGRTDVPGVYAAGDCANHYSRFAEGWLRLESVQHAQDQGRAAGLAIADRHQPYDSVPRFWSDQYDLKLQIVGLSGRCDQMVTRGSIDEGRFSVFHYRRERLVAVDSINKSGDQMAARRLIAAGISPTPQQAADGAFDIKALLKTS